LTAASNQNTIVPLNWSAPSSDGGSPIDYYVVWYGTDPTFASYTALVPNPTSGPVTIHGLLNGTLYYFQVFAHNASGNGATASTSATPSTTPDAPTDLAATWYQNGQVPLSWTAPYDDGGSSITDYKIQYKPSLHSAWNFFVHSMSSQTSITVTGLMNGISYDFRVAAANVNGVGLYSAEVSAIPSTVPDAPVNLKVVPGNSQVYVSWSDGPSDGGSPITNYKIEYKLNTTLVPPGQWSVQYSMTTTTIYFLKNGSLYNFQVRAINASGLSNPSTMVNATPFAPLTTSCGIINFVPGPPLWSRAGGNNCPNCVSNYGYVACGPNGEPYSTYALDQRRKAEILKYRNNSAQLSPAMFYSMISRNAFTRKKSWATQTQTYTNPNVNKLPEIKNASGETVALQCNQPPVLCSLSSGSDVPGPVIPLCIDESVPLYNYKMQVTNASGGNFESFTTFQEPPQPQPIPAPVPPPPPPISNQIYFNTTSQTITTYIDEQGGESQIPVQGGSTVVQIRVAGSVVTFNFTSSGSSANQVLTRVVCVGGGGAGGLTIQSNVFFTGGGGGGAGGFQDVFTNYTLFQNYTCFVGTGGQNPIGGPPVAATSSYVDLATQQMTCYAGGCGLGLNFTSTNPNGGSGGGSWTSLIPGTGVSGQGFDGGGSVGSFTNPRGGGGGGASEVGLNSINGGDGGNGVSTSIFPFIPTGLFLAGGGGAGTGPNYQIATGGKGGGGNSDTDAVQWTGGGGGGQSKTANSRAGNGGDGFIAFSFPTFVP